MRHPLATFIGWIITLTSLQAQTSVKKQDSLPAMLLTNMEIQADLSEALDWMYNFEFDKSEAVYQKLKQKYPEHPLPYFVVGLNYWWKIAGSPKLTTYDETFYSYMDSAITKASKMYNLNPKNPEASFFLAGAYAFKGRLLSDRSQWGKATVAAKNALTYLKRGKAINALSPEFLFGDGLYNYYSVWVSENYPALQPVLAFFPKGDKKLGIEQLEEVSRKAFYTRVEASFFLTEIYMFREKDENGSYHLVNKAIPLSERLYKSYPNNSYAHRYYARALFQAGGERKTMEAVCLSLLEKTENKAPGYDEVCGRYGSFFLATYYDGRDKQKAQHYYEKTVFYAEAIEAYDSGYYTNSLQRLAQMAKDRNDLETAQKYYDKLSKHSQKKSSRRAARKESKEIKKAVKAAKKASDE